MRLEPPDISDVPIMLGGAAVLYGLWLIAEPVALLVGGLALAGFGWALHRARRR